MARGEAGGTVRLSVLDRLRHSSGEGWASASWNDSVAALEQSLFRDLEWLLNTRRTSEPATEDFPEVRRSVYHYGLPDLSSLSADSTEIRRRLRREVEELLETFEPRLTGVRVSLAEGEDERVQQIPLHVEALLRLDPEPQRISFDTVLELASGKIGVSGRQHA